MRVMAHRGFSSQAPENTLAAFKKAIEFGCQWIELDVQLTADHIPVVIHDQTLERCTNGAGKVAEMTLAELQQYSAGDWFNQAFSNETIPTLEDTLRLAKTHNIGLNIELKPYPGDDEALLCEKVADAIHAVDISDNQIIFSSFSVSALEQIKKALPTIRRGLLWEEMPDSAFDILSKLEAFSVHCDYRHLSEKQALEIKNRGYALYCYTPNNPMDVQAFWQWGVDMMITDKPHRYAH
ncbi:glycerophosphoryl diester phosphodiesterase [Vibrio sp.]|uniref:Glycerophosphoryl diester phosphodiesterase n=1 Tax=Vibrio viridaestus TaxID=2487322 RepID=A0A3N9TJ69_9VIBR|nr:glycerophosphoryl diester phosphodiesterase [Vibrio viridaestus]MDC0610344.1 glycerophosphoryl diester phosphodiesterase [Vibrio sp.]RQW64329.1 glycerophosphoryl diester phosphodiesterase [Vibrio viridaestus]